MRLNKVILLQRGVEFPRLDVYGIWRLRCIFMCGYTLGLVFGKSFVSPLEKGRRILTRSATLLTCEECVQVIRGGCEFALSGVSCVAVASLRYPGAMIP